MAIDSKYVGKVTKAGERLRKIRNRLGISARALEDFTRAIALDEGNQEFFISHGRIIQIENDESTPSIYKLFSLSAVYGVKITELLEFYLDLDNLAKYQLKTELGVTHLKDIDTYNDERPLSFPIRFDPAFQAEKSCLLSRMIEAWGEVPTAVLRHLSIRKMRYGYIGLNDYTLYPLLRPGSFVLIDDHQRNVNNDIARTSELERPIYFVELREGYLCAWCEKQGNQLIVVPHPASPCQVRSFTCPNEAEIVGRVVAVAARLTELGEGRDSGGRVFQRPDSNSK